jgi:hypothetical protein
VLGGFRIGYTIGRSYTCRWRSWCAERRVTYSSGPLRQMCAKNLRSLAQCRRRVDGIDTALRGIDDSKVRLPMIIGVTGNGTGVDRDRRRPERVHRTVTR